MKKIYSLFIMKQQFSVCFMIVLFSFLAGSIFSQAEKCGTMSNHKTLLENDPSYAKKINDAEVLARDWLKNHPASSSNSKIKSTPLVVPVVFHVMYPNTSSPAYLPDSIFIRQIAILNEAYSLSNPNYSNTRNIFDSLGVNTGIQFCLAQNDPQGNPCTGIDRFQTSTSFSLTPINNSVKIPSATAGQGGRAPWNPKYYLNIWSCDMKVFAQNFVLGYSTFPGGPDSLDGVVLEYDFVGFQNNGTVNNLGKTAVHEVGHWFGMRHIWGDGQQASGTGPCDSTDYVADTPHANNASQTDCDTTKNTCSTEDIFWTQFGIDPPDMVENYMDYSNDGCMTMFTKGQKARMWSFINTLRSDLLTTVSCSSVGIDHYNAAFGDFLHVYPNPSSEGFLNINFSVNSIEMTKVEFFNSTGQLVKSFIPAGFQNVVDVKGLAGGIYFIKISNPSNSAVKKIILE